VSLRARKRFGQHFLTSDEVIANIVAAIAPQAGQTIVEIGPGRAAITAPIASTGATLHAIEFDRDLVARLQRQFADSGNVRVHEGDALAFDFASLGDRQRVVGNLPYNISTPLLFHLLDFRSHIEDLHFMLQKEVVDRMAAAPGSKDYGRLTVMLAARLEIISLFDVTPDAFTPPPRVMSSVVRMRPLPAGTYPGCDDAVLEHIVRQAFSRRRKTLRNALQGSIDATGIEAAGLDPGIRPEQVPVADWINLANELTRQK
jgi:16S rRNA (adenine1518-N6/adenine1519-N6)-dimethyltransferase